MARLEREFTFDLVSFARPGPARRDHLTATETQQIARIVGRTPEVMIKVLSHGASDVSAVRRHLDYIGRRGEVELETDDGRSLHGPADTRALMDEWDLDLDSLRDRVDLTARSLNEAPRLVHKLMFSMPPGTPPAKVLKAVQSFCREEFAIQHRYAMALHTDEPHPHVHVVVKAISEDGRRLNIQKATLRSWREGFAHHLRVLGIPANATQRYVRGQFTLRKPDGIYRAGLRGNSTHVRERPSGVVCDSTRDGANVATGKARLIETYNTLRHAWWTLSNILIRDQHAELAAQVRRFVEQVPSPMTERQREVSKWAGPARVPRAREGPSR